MADALLLEWDGVLVDTRAMRAESLARALEEERLPAIAPRAGGDAADVDAGVEQLVSAALSAAGRADDDTLQEIVILRARRAFAERLAQGVTLVPGSAAFLASCEPRARVVLVTRAARTETEQLVRQAGWETAVASIIASDDVPAGAGWPGQVARALEQLARRGISRAGDVILLGRSVHAFRAARALGVRTVAVGAPAHVAVEADGAVHSMMDLTFDLVASVAREAAARGAR